MITIPIFDYQCQDCKQIFENIEVWTQHIAKECKFCKSPNITKIMALWIVRMDADTVKHNMPDPCPPLEELRGKAVPGSESGLRDKPEASTNLGKYNRKKDKRGNTYWIPKKTKYFV